MDAGMVNAHDTWNAVAPAISKLTRTCTYDRAFEGRSDPTPCCATRTSADVVSDLRRLLSRAGVAPPYLLVGHSFGGLNMRVFAGTHPHDVVGLVLINPTGSFDGECAISASICADDKASWASNPERIQIERSMRELAATRLPPIPLILLLNRWERDPNIGARLFRRLERRARRDSQRLVASVSDGRLEIVPGGHFTQEDHPAIVIKAISAVLKKTRTR
jgi:pimeloyl-ACP methyl ester carboxylesterase